MTGTAPAGEPQILYLEPDDEITSVVRRLAETDAGRVILVAPGRTRATTSAIGLRLLARRAVGSGQSLALVADAAARALAGDAGIEAFPTIAEALGGRAGASGHEPGPPPRAAIHVVRGERGVTPSLAAPRSPTGPAGGTATGLAAGALAAGALATPNGLAAADALRMDVTQPVPVVGPAPRPRVARPRRPSRSLTWSRATLAAVLAALVVVGAAVAAVIPAATIRLVPAVTRVGPVSYTVTLAGTADSGTLQSTQGGTATGTYDDSTPAKGTVTFANYTSKKVQVPKGTPVSAGNLVFTTDASVTVPGGSRFGGGGTADVAVTAKAAGPSGNVDTGAIDTIDDSQVASDLCGGFTLLCPRLVANRAPLTGGATKTGSQVTQKDVDSVVAAITADLQRQLAGRLAADPARVYARPPEGQAPAIDIPSGLVGKKDQATFELSGVLNYDRRYVTDDQLSQAAIDRLQADNRTVPTGTELVDRSVSVQPGELTASGNQVSGPVAVQAAITRRLDLEALKSRIAGRSRADAERELAAYGQVSIGLWPGWVEAVPRLPFRIDLSVEAPGASPQPSGGAPAGSP